MADVALSLNGQRPEMPLVDVFDKPFRLRSITRSVEQTLGALDKKRRALDEDDANADAVVELLSSVLDAMLTPEGHKTAAKTLVVAKWKADELSLGDIARFTEQLQETAVKQRPT
jgi:hypothetical protein